MGKGGGGGHTPYEAPESGRSKQRIKIVEIISEGEIQGLKEGVKSVYLDKTPVQNADGSYNFRNMELQGTIGSQEQDIMRGFNTSEREVPVGVEVKKNAPIVRTINDSKVNRLRITVGVRSLFDQKENGDTVGTTVNLLIRVGESERQVTISGKYSAQYLRQIVIDNLPATPFNVTVLRVEADSTKQRLQNATIWSSYTEIIDTEFAYPNTALAGLMFDSEYFSNLPQRNYLVRGIKVKVPSNYDPISRSYNGLWDGRFKIAWTNNPAWIFYDLMTNKRYGMGQRLGDFGVDKWALYAIAQYCDVSVPDGFGGTEPRMTCNCWLTEQRQAYDLINDLASIFRAMPVWNGQQLTAIQDRPSDPVWTYTNANVVNGEFERGYSALKARHNIIHVEYLDKNDFFEKKIEYVSDDESVKRYGANVKKVTAFGCTSRGQAYRLGRWILETEKLEKETITFAVGREGLMHLPGDIIQIADNHYAGTNIGGRVLAINGRNITLDREITLSSEMYLSYINAEARQQTIKISSVNRNIVTLDNNPAGLKEFGVWALTTSAVRGGLYRAVSISEDENGIYTIVALQHEPQKEAIVDNGAHFEEVSKTLYTAPRLSDIAIDTSSGTGAYVSAEVLTGNAIVTRYDILIYQGEKLYQSYIGQKTAEVKLDNLPNGDYSVVIIAKDDKGRVLSEKASTFTIDRPPAPTGVAVNGGLENILIEWDYVDEFTQTEIFFAVDDNLLEAKRLIKVSNAFMYAHKVQPNSVFYYWLRHTRGQNIGPFYQVSGLRGETSVDIQKALAELQKELSENIVDEVIDTGLAARGLEAVKIVETIGDLAEFKDANLIYNLSDRRFYMWKGDRYESFTLDSVPVSAIQGQIVTQQLAANAVTADKLAANSVTAGSVQAGAIRGTHIAAGELTADKLAIGLGGNLLYNPIFANNADGWTLYQDTSVVQANVGIAINNNTEGKWQGKEYLPTENQYRWQPNMVNPISPAGRFGGVYQDIKVIAGRWYILSGYVAAHRGFMRVDVVLRDGLEISNVTYSYPSDETGDTNAVSYTNGLVDTTRIWIKFKVTTTGTARCIFNQYKIENVYNTFTVLRRPMLEECTAYTREPSPWQNAGVTAIHGGSLRTGTVVADKLAANSVTTEKLVAGAVDASKIAAKAITSNHIATKTISADKLNVTNLSSISANLGDIKGGSLNINNRFKVSGSGDVEIRGASGNVGMVIRNERIDVYDEKGVLKVRLGRL
ncbi:phage tail protein [Gallibacterium salpingitidis]|uniref:host specificity protein J n=1 Tax=Gallibacterium salpingitidis TaxID=505341 RepID=UPI002670230D|nr:phage tail protein [Gallibacterium salpingitidis]WKS98727.1 phage tail protein [Gallibacterium salpingitidis]